MFDEIDYYVITNIIKGTPDEVIARHLSDGTLALRNYLSKYEQLGMKFYSGMSMRISKTDLKVFNQLLKGVSVEDIAKNLNISVSDAKSAKNKFYKLRKQFAEKNDVKGIIKDLRNNESYSNNELAEVLGLAPHHVYKIRREMRDEGIDESRKKAKSHESHDLDRKIAALLVHHSQSETARILGLSRQAIFQRVKKFEEENLDGEAIVRESVMKFIQKNKPSYKEFMKLAEQVQDYYGMDVTDLYDRSKIAQDYGIVER